MTQATGPGPAEEFEVQIEKWADTAPPPIAGEARLTFVDGVMLVTKRLPRAAEPLEKRVPLSQVMNVMWGGNQVSFDRMIEGTLCARTVLRARDNAEADRIAHHLPPQVTDAFAAAYLDRQRFVQELNLATPQVRVTPAIIAINVAVFVMMGLSGLGWMDPPTDGLLKWGGDFWPNTTSGEWWRLVTSMFLHGGLLHIAFNMWALRGVGRLVERIFGNALFGFLYLFAGVAASLTSLYFNREAVSVGASGAIFGVYGALLAYVLLHPHSFPQGMAGPILRSAVVFVVYNVVFGFSHGSALGGAQHMVIDNAAHLGGLLGGFLMGAALARPLEPGARRRATPLRLALGTLLAVGGIAGGVAAVPRATAEDRRMAANDRRLAEVLPQVAREEGEGVDAYNRLVEELNAKKIDEEAFAAGVDREVTPRFSQIVDQLASLKPSPTSPRAATFGTLLEYYQAKRDSYRLMVEGIREKDARKMAESQKLSARANALLEQSDHQRRR